LVVSTLSVIYARGMAVEAVLAFLVLPFGLGYLLGHGAYAAAVFVALGLTTLTLQATGGGDGEVMPAFAFGLILSAAPAFAGGLLRERRRERRERS
jgi:hypothetical protein